MEDLTKAITTETARWPEGAPITAAAFLHLGNRPAVSRALRTLAKRSEILRIARGVYLAPVFTRFGRHSPGVHGFIQQLSIRSRAAIAPSGAACANALGLTTQVPVKSIYWTSGRTRTYRLGKLTIHLLHVPDCQLVLWREPAGELVRVLAWAGPTEASKVLRQIVEKVTKAAVTRVQQHAALFPPWLRDALRQIVMPCARSAGGKRDMPHYLEATESDEAKSKMKKETPSLSLSA